MDEKVMTFLIILVILSVILNIYQYFQIKRYQLNERSFKASWQEVMNLKNPISLILWWMLASSLIIGLIGLVTGFLR